MDLSVAVYALTRTFPRDEVYGLTSQLRRAGVSIASNIAEGYGRGSRDQYRHLLSIANGSCLELQTQLQVTDRLLFADAAEVDQVANLASEIAECCPRY
ncbi:MAG: four helix bundle protein [Acidobacteriaceae bacterium]